MPPRRTSTIPDDKTSSAPTPPPSGKHKDRIEAINGLMQIGQFGCLTFGRYADAGAIGMHGPNLANEIANLADSQPKVAQKVDLLLEVGPYAGLITAALPFVAQILVNAGVFKAEAFANAGVVHPDTLEAQMKAQLAEQALNAMRMQAEAEKALEEQRLMMQEMADERAEQNSNGE